MSQSRTFDSSAPRNTSLLNRQQSKVAHSGLYSGYNVVIDTGTVGAADTIKIINAPDLTSVLVSREGVRIEETGPDPISSLSVVTADVTDPRIDIVVAQHTFSTSNNPATYAVIAGTPAPSPAPPAIPIDAVVLAEVHVAALAGSIAIQNIVRRPKEQASLDDEDTSRLNNLEKETHASVATLAALKAILPEERFDGQMIIVDDTFPGGGTSAIYRFDASSSVTASDPIIVSPTTFALGTDGRWIFQSYFNEGTFVVTVGGDTPGGDFLVGELVDALQAFEDSSYREALIIIRDDITYSGPDVTVSKPIKFLGLARPGATGFHGPTLAHTAGTLTFDVQPQFFAGPLGRVEFENVRYTRDPSPGTDRIIFTSPTLLKFSHCVVRDASFAGASTPAIEFASTDCHIMAEKTQFLNEATTGQALIETTATNGSFRVTMSECVGDAVPTSGEIFKSDGSGIVFITLTNYSVMSMDSFPNNTTIDLDGTPGYRNPRFPFR